ncbi:hypothetical protein BH20VER1_BH20VER1_04290 [soil metagenome]
MINVLRKNQRMLWIVIGFLAIPFIFYFSKSDPFKAGSNVVGKLYDKPVTVVDFQRSTRLFVLARELGMFTYLQDLVGNAKSEDEAYAAFAWNRLVVRHEAERLGLRATPQEVANVVRELRPFRSAKGFDLEQYNQFTQQMLPALGFTESHIEELASDQLVLARLRDVLATGMEVPEAETRENYTRAYGKLNTAVVRLRTDDFEKQVQVSDEDVTQYFEAQKLSLNTEEKRKVGIVALALNEEQKKLEGRERVEVLQKLADRANDFNQALLEKGAQFEQVAQKFELPVQTTGEFTRSKPDPLLTANPQLSEAAFRLTQENPTSDAMQAGDGFYVLHLAGIEPPRPLTLEEARPQVVEAIKTQRIRALMAARAGEITQKLRAAVSAGTPLEVAAQEAGVSVEKIPPFALADQPTPPAEPGKEPPPPEAPDLQMIKAIISEMDPGEVSEFVPTATGGLMAVLERRDEPDAAAYEQGKAQFVSRLMRGRRDLAFYEWLAERRREAGVPETPAEQQPIATG